MKGLFLVLLALCCCCVALAQNNTDPQPRRYDSLITHIRRHVTSIRLDSLLPIAHEAYELSVSEKDTFKIVESARIIGQINNKLNRPKEASVVLERHRLMAKRCCREEYKKVINNLGISFSFLGRFDLALDRYFELYSLALLDNDRVNLMLALVNIGHAYDCLKNHKEALMYWEDALKVEGFESPTDKHLLQINIAAVKTKLNDFRGASVAFNSVLKECEAGGCEPFIQTILHLQLGNLHFLRHDFELATIHLEKCIELSHQYYFPQKTAEGMRILASMDIEKHDYPKALNRLHNAEQLLDRQQHALTCVSVYESLSLIYERLDDKERYTRYLKKYVELRDSISSPQILNSVIESHVKLANLRARGESPKQRLVVYLAVACVLAIILISVLLWNLKTVGKIAKRLDKSLASARSSLVNSAELAMNRRSALRSEFNYAAQQINAPLATLKGMCNLAILEVKDDVSKEYFTRIDKTTAELQSIVNRISSGEESGFDLASVVDEIVITAQQLAFSSNVDLQNNVSRNVIFNCSRKRFIGTVTDVVSGLMNTCGNARVNITFASSGEVSRNTLLLLVASYPPTEPDIDLLVHTLSEEEVRPVVKKFPNYCYEISLEF